MKKTKKGKVKNTNTDNLVTMFYAPFYNFQYCLVRGEEELKKLCEVNKIDFLLFDPLSKMARCENFRNDDGFVLNIVRMPEEKEYTFAERIGLLVHECTHVKQNFMAEIGETKPSEEFEAYMLQEIFTNLIGEYLKHE